MNFKRKTDAEENAICLKGDYTCGYNFVEWLVFLRRWHLIGTLANMAVGLGMLFSNSENDPTMKWLGIGFSFVVPAILWFMLVRDYKNGKKGIST